MTGPSGNWEEIPLLASGGIVPEPSTRLIGDGDVPEQIVPLTPPNLSFTDLRSVAFGNPTQGERERVERALSAGRERLRVPSGIVSVRIGDQHFVQAQLFAETADALVEATDAVEGLRAENERLQSTEADAWAEVERLRAELTQLRDRDVVVRYSRGVVAIDWPDGRGPAIVQPEVVEGWAEAMNAQRAMLAELVQAVDSHCDVDHGTSGCPFEVLDRVKRETHLG